jgi:ElaB/YqjD/DUF883 family membrane-anchored ribosome-binding protein
MNQEIQDITHDMGKLAEDARVLIAATVDMAGEEVGEARKRLSEALEFGKGKFDRIRGKAVQGVKAADEAVHKYPYPLFGLAVGIGVVLGFLVTRRWD